ncbi:hypothetical protein QL285_004300 [Trifolium repens]|nr:hypothetical protein QL285_052438 [Trifolium repens]KAK2456983.1 hypothetical protein QL285_004300 [Trifolium repens]
MSNMPSLDSTFSVEHQKHPCSEDALTELSSMNEMLMHAGLEKKSGEHHILLSIAIKRRNLSRFRKKA